jgi:hypothetical protein
MKLEPHHRLERSSLPYKGSASPYMLVWLERVEGVEPSSSAWKAVALPLSYTRWEGWPDLIPAMARSVGVKPTTSEAILCVYDLRSLCPSTAHPIET